jgi:Flp pilus assembly protein TadG
LRRKIDTAAGRLTEHLRARPFERQRFLGRDHRARNAVRSENGQALVEFALTSCILMSFVFGLIEVCLAFYTYGMISECAREATRYAIVRGSTCVTSSNTSCTVSASAINTYASGRGWPNLGGGTINVTTTYPDGNEAPGSRVQVQIRYIFPIRIPLAPSHSLSMASLSEMYIVQ